MRADSRFLSESKPFWANVRTIGQALGYTVRGSGQVRVYSIAEMAAAMTQVGLRSEHLIGPSGPTVLGAALEAYFTYRADTLNRVVEPLLMDAPEAKKLFAKLYRQLKPKCPIPLNKQKGTKAGPALLTGLVNMLLEQALKPLPIDYDPRELTTATRNGAPLRTLARRVDGAFPATVNPIAIWEIKEYYHTTTFGSRVADGVYETLLDGMELQELREHEGIQIEHLLVLDSHFTWWECGRSYLCRVVDMLNMGSVTEVIFGKEVLTRLPQLASEWRVSFERGRGK